MTTDPASRLQLPKKSHNASQSAPAATTRKEQQLIQEAIQKSLEDHKPAGQQAAGSAQGAGKPVDGGEAEVQVVEDSDSAGPGPRHASGKRGRQAVLNSSDDDDEDDSEDDKGASSGSDFSEEDASDSDESASLVSDSEDEKEVVKPAKRQKQGAGRQSAPARSPVQPDPTSATAKGRAKAAATNKASASAPAAHKLTPAPKRTPPARKTPGTAGKTAPLQPSSAGNVAEAKAAPQTTVKAASLPQQPGGCTPADSKAAASSKAKVALKSCNAQENAAAGKRPMTNATTVSKGQPEKVAERQTSTPAASKGPSGPAPSMQHVPAAKVNTPSTAITPLQRSAVKRMTPASGPLSSILPAGPQFRVSGLRRAGGIKLHNVGSYQK